MRRVSRLRAGVATLTAGFVLFAAACTPGTSPGSRPIPPGGGVAAYTAGSAGLGDPYYPDAGNGGYDVASYLLDLRYDPGTDTLAGSATITAVATANLSQFNLDFRALTVHAVTIDGIVAGARTAGDELVVSPGLGIIKGRQFVIAVRYSGVPSGYDDPALGEMGFLHTKDGAVAIGEPHVAASWFPVNDHPSDKATYTIKITAPEGLAALSNGVLRNRQSDSGWTTWTWLESQPMAPYLAMVAIGRYRVAQRTSGTRQLVTAVDAALPEGIDAQLARTPAIVAFLESRFGPYPFDALGGIVIDDSRINFSEPGGSLGWALENQSRPLYSRTFFEPGEDGTWVIVHELAHQWFGNSVTVRDWSEIWLNEGFATYAEWLWFDDKGVRSAQQTFDDLYAKANAPMWQVPPGDPGRDRMFDPSHSVYDRGAMTLHALRLRVGDDTFFTILKGWAAQKVHQNATTDEFIAFAEKISGVALDALFQEWLYELGRPPLPRR